MSPRVNNRKGSLNKTPDVTCECGHRDGSHVHVAVNGEAATDCWFCDCKGFVPRDRSIPSQPVQFSGTSARAFGPRQVARRNEDAS